MLRICQKLLVGIWLNNKTEAVWAMDNKISTICVNITILMPLFTN